MKFWRSTRKIKVVRYNEYERFQNNTAPFTDSDSDFESRPSTKNIRETIDLTVSEDTAGVLKSRIDSLEQELNKTVEKYEETERLRRIVSCLEKENSEYPSEKRSLQFIIDKVKENMSCIICKSVASFPWAITPCYKILNCKECWLLVEETCPHCRAVLERSSLVEVAEIRPMQEIIKYWMITNVPQVYYREVD